MENYSIGISPGAERDLKELRNKLPDIDSLVSVVDDLSIEPKPFGVRKIKGFNTIFRIRFYS